MFRLPPAGEVAGGADGASGFKERVWTPSGVFISKSLGEGLGGGAWGRGGGS